MRARGISFAVFSSPAGWYGAAADLRERRNALRSLDALAGTIAARRATSAHSLRSARPRRVVRAAALRSTRRSRTTPATSARCGARWAFGAATCSAIRGAEGSPCWRQPPIPPAVRRLVLVDPVWNTSAWMAPLRRNVINRLDPAGSARPWNASPRSARQSRPGAAQRVQPSRLSSMVYGCMTWRAGLPRRWPRAQPGAAVLARLRRDGYDWRPKLRALVHAGTRHPGRRGSFTFGGLCRDFIHR